jgi:hypothetical protein
MGFDLMHVHFPLSMALTLYHSLDVQHEAAWLCTFLPILPDSHAVLAMEPGEVTWIFGTGTGTGTAAVPVFDTLTSLLLADSWRCCYEGTEAAEARRPAGTTREQDMAAH